MTVIELYAVLGRAIKDGCGAAEVGIHNDHGGYLEVPGDEATMINVEKKPDKETELAYTGDPKDGFFSLGKISGMEPTFDNWSYAFKPVRSYTPVIGASGNLTVGISNVPLP